MCNTHTYIYNHTHTYTCTRHVGEWADSAGGIRPRVPRPNHVHIFIYISHIHLYLHTHTHLRIQGMSAEELAVLEPPYNVRLDRPLVTTDGTSVGIEVKRYSLSKVTSESIFATYYTVIWKREHILKSHLATIFTLCRHLYRRVTHEWKVTHKRVYILTRSHQVQVKRYKNDANNFSKVTIMFVLYIIYVITRWLEYSIPQ